MAKEINVDININTDSVRYMKLQIIEAKEQLSQLAQGSDEFKKVDKRLNELTKSVKNLNGELIDLDATFEQVYGDLQPMTTRLGELEDRLYELALAGKSGTKEFQELTKEAGKLRQTIVQTDLKVDAMSKTMTQKLTGGVTGVVSAFAIAQGAMGLFGSESENVEKALLKVQSAMAIMQGISSFKEVLPDIKALGSSLIAMIPSINGATVAQTELNATMEMNPFGLVIAGVTAVLGAYYLFSNSSEKASEAEKKREKAIVERAKAQEKASKDEARELASTQSAYVMQIGMLSKTNAGSKERLALINDINKEYGTSLKNLQDEGKFQGQLADSLEKYLVLKRVEFQVKKNEAYFESLMTKEGVARKQLAKDDVEITKAQIEQLQKLSNVKANGALVSDRQVYINKILGNQSTTEYDSRQKGIDQLVKVLNEQEKVTESTFKLQKAKQGLIDIPGFGTTATKEEVEVHKELANTLDTLTQQNNEYGKSEEELALIKKEKRDKEIEDQFKISTDTDKNTQKEKALAESKIAYDNDITEIKNKNAQKEIADELALYNKVKDIGKNKLQLRKEDYVNDLADLKEAFDKKLIDEEEYLIKKAALEKDYRNDEKAIVAEGEKTAKDNAKKIVDAEVEKYQQIHETVQYYLDGAKNISDAFFAWGDRRRQEDAESELSKYREGTVEYENAKKNQEKIQEQSAKRAFNINKAFQLASAINDGTLAVLSVFAETPGELIIKSSAAAVAGVFAAANIARIAASQYKSSASSGGGASSSASIPAQPTIGLYGQANQGNVVNAGTTSQLQTINFNASISVDEITKKQAQMVRIKDGGTL